MSHNFISYLRHLKSHIAGIVFDLFHGVETNSAVNENQLGFKNSSSYPYIPVDPISLQKILSKLPISTEDIFCDIGCGKGRALIIASMFPFKKVIGIDIHPTLIDRAKVNIQKYKKSEVYCQDATQAAFNDEVTWLFMACPFTGELFDQFLIHLEDSLERNPRNFYFLYQTPIENERILQSKYFSSMEVPIKKYQKSYHFYQSILQPKNLKK